jgi:hypothetical protein
MAAKRIQLKEVPIFEMSCEKGHNFAPVVDSEGEVRGYYKSLNGDKAEKDRARVYGMLFCSKCGVTKEIVIVNYIRS